jgi:glucosyl-3-phosphoglycerate synthase
VEDIGQTVVATSNRTAGAFSVDDWFERHSFPHSRFSDIDALARSKRDLGVSVSVVLPAREVAGTIGTIVAAINALAERATLVDQVMVIDADSGDGTASIAAAGGAEVYSENELLAELGPALGKGDAMWRALSVARGDLVLYLDSDTEDFEQRFVYGTLGPLLEFPGLRFVKGAYRRARPGGADGEGEVDGGGRVTELTARPLLNLFYPELTGFAQPLAGEVAAARELLCSIPFSTGYAVEIGMLVDVARAAGVDAMCQVDLEKRTNKSQGLLELGPMAYEVLRAIASRLRTEGRLGDAPGDGGLSSLASDGYVRALRRQSALAVERLPVEIAERPPMRELERG